MHFAVRAICIGCICSFVAPVGHHCRGLVQYAAIDLVRSGSQVTGERLEGLCHHRMAEFLCFFYPKRTPMTDLERVLAMLKEMLDTALDLESQEFEPTASEALRDAISEVEDMITGRQKNTDSREGPR